MKLVAGYIRVSTEQQAEDNSHVRQKETVSEWCENNVEGEYRIEWYEDIAESGQQLSRDEYDTLMDSCHKFDIVAVRELSRFGRSMQRLLQDIEILEENGCNFVSVKDEEIDTTSAQGQLLFHMIAAFNQFWADLARERTLELIEKKKENGESWGRDKKLSDDQIMWLWEQKVDNGHSYAVLARIAEAKGWTDSITRNTIYRYMNQVRDGEIGDREPTVAEKLMDGDS